MAELSQQELEVLVEGVPHPPRVVFYDKARLNVLKSKEDGRRIYDTVTYLKETQAGVTDWIPVKARDIHKKQYQEEYRQYLMNKQGERSPSIDIIPNMTPAEKQELIDYGLGTIRLLSEAAQVPPHLEHIRKNALVLQSVLKEQKDGSINDTEGDHRQEEGFQEEVISETRNVSEEDRCIDTRDVGKPALPESTPIRERETTEGIRSSGRYNHKQAVTWSDPNWSIKVS